MLAAECVFHQLGSGAAHAVVFDGDQQAAIHTRISGDMYVSLGEALDANTWTLRVYIKPFVDWIWGGCLLMAIGGGVAASDRRYRVRAKAAAAAEPTAEADTVGAVPPVGAAA